MSSYVHFYHYTSERGLNGIKSSGYIKNSSEEKNHAHFGIGAYGTSLPPWEGKERIAQNNWRDHGVFYIQNGKVDWAVDVKMPRHKVRKVPWRNKRYTRDILVHDGPVHLDDYDWRALRVSNDFDPHGEYRARSIRYTKATSGDSDDEPVRYSTDPYSYSFASRPISHTASDSSVRCSTDTYRHSLAATSSTQSFRRAEETTPRIQTPPARPVTTEVYRPSTSPRMYASPSYESRKKDDDSLCTIL